MKVLFFISIALTLSCAQCAGGPFTASISIAGEQEVGEDVICKVTIMNSFNQDYYLLKRNTPLEGLRSSVLFSVVSNTKNKPVQYEGLLFKRAAPTLEEYLRVPARSSLSASVDLTLAYNIQEADTYSIQLKMDLQYFEAGLGQPTNTSSQTVSSNISQFSTTGNKPPKLTIAQTLLKNMSQDFESTSEVNGAITPSFSGTGTSRDQTTAKTAFATAYSAVYKSYQSVTSDLRSYQTWFGPTYYSNYVMGIYLSVYEAMGNTRFTLYFHGPECDKGVFAYTFFRSTYLYLCDGYFAAPTTGSDSKVGTLVHELTHAVGETEDYEYGEAACQNLALNDPQRAIMNADNYEYFTEAHL